MIRPDDSHDQRLVANTHPAGWPVATAKGTYNLVVLGGGPAGLVAAFGAAGLGARVALIEKGLLVGVQAHNVRIAVSLQNDISHY